MCYGVAADGGWCGRDGQGRKGGDGSMSNSSGSMSSSSEDRDRRVVLEGVPRVGFYPQMQQHDDTKMRCPEDVCFPSCLRACLESMGDGLGCRSIGLASREWQVGCGYAYLLGVTGVAFQLSWLPGWHPDNVASWLVGSDPGEIFRRAFAAIGYECETVRHAELHQDGDSDALGRRRIIESIRDKGRPVIAHGVIGPPEECIIAGYDDGGDVLIGWSFFQHGPENAGSVEFEPNGMFRKRDWFADTWSLILIGDKGEPPDRKQVYRDALSWAIEVVRTPMRGGRHNGLGAYDAWAEHLLRDDEFATDDMAALGVRFMVHDDAVGRVAEGRWYASVYLAEAAGLAGLKAPGLYAAASCCAAEHDLMWKVWGLVGGIGRGDDRVRKLAEPDVRRQIVPIIHEARDLDAKAAEHIERVLGDGAG